LRCAARRARHAEQQRRQQYATKWRS
jgi:hypothetical protein